MEVVPFGVPSAGSGRDYSSGHRLRGAVSSQRAGDTCIENENVSVKWRILSLLLSIVAIALMIGCRINCFEWKSHHPKTFKDLPPMILYSLIECLHLLKPFTPMQYLVGGAAHYLHASVFPLSLGGLYRFGAAADQLRDGVGLLLRLRNTVCHDVSQSLPTDNRGFNYGKYFNPIAMRIGEKHGSGSL